MVAISGFPRPLYPSDASGQQPSVDVGAVDGRLVAGGNFRPGVIRLASRAAARMTTSRNPGSPAYKASRGWQANGYVERDTFNLLRSIRIPPGLPQAGEAAMDARVVKLVNAACERFAGQEPPPAGGSTAKARLEEAQRDVGQRAAAIVERLPAVHTLVPDARPCCAVFVAYCDRNGDQPDRQPHPAAAATCVPYIVIRPARL